MALQTEYSTERSLSRDLVPPSPSGRSTATRPGSLRPDQHMGDWSQRGPLTSKKLGTKGSEVLDKAQAEAYFSDLLSYRRGHCLGAPLAFCAGVSIGLLGKGCSNSCMADFLLTVQMIPPLLRCMRKRQCLRPAFSTCDFPSLPYSLHEVHTVD